MPQLFRHGYAIVVGVDPETTAKDATAVAELLKNDSRCAYPIDQVQLLTDKTATRDDVVSALDWLKRSANDDPDSTAIVYFSGHGVETPDYYLLTYGYDRYNLAGTALAGKTFNEHLHAIRAKKLLVLLDCCYAGGQAEVKGFNESPVPPEVLDQLASVSGRVLLASSRRNEVSYTGTPYSVYTNALLEALAGYGAFEQDGYARVLDVAMWVGRKVPERTGDKQHPILKVKDLQDNFAIAWYAGGAKEPRPLSASDRILPTRRSQLNEDETMARREQLDNYRKNLLQIEVRISEYIQATNIPLDLIKDKRETERKISELEQVLGWAGGNMTEPDAKESESGLGRDAGIPSVPPPRPKPPQTHHVPFTNREDEIRQITSNYAPAYYLLDAPAGYGKTELLKQLEKRFKERNWCSVYVATGTKNTLAALVHAIAEKLDIWLDSEDEIPEVIQLGGKIRKLWETPNEQGRKEGLVVLVDLDRAPSQSVLRDVLDTMIPSIEGILRALAAFATRHTRFRVIVAGRYLISIAPSKTGVEPTKLRLSPFSYEVIRNTVFEYLPEQEGTSTDLLAAHLFHLTGGHPGCMAHILEEYKERPIAPDYLLHDDYSDFWWRKVIRSYVDDIRDHIAQSPKDLRSLLEKVSVFRLLDTDMLGNLNANLLDENYTDIHLADDLTTTYLLNWHGRFLRDDITRRLLAVRLRQEYPQEFQKRCEEARSICAERLRLPSVQSPEMWTIEYLFQSLQRFAPSIRDHGTRSHLQREFFAIDVPAALELFLDTCDSLPRRYFQEQQVLLRAMDEDWEFRFTVNYYMRETTFNEQPYAQLQQEIVTYFASKHAGGGHNA